MTVVLILVAWWLFVLAAVALCRSAGRPAPHPPRPRSKTDALTAMGDEADTVQFDYLGGWRNRG